MNNSIEIKGLNKFYGKKQALFDVDLSIRQGMFGLMGRNGAGKTSTIKAVVGIRGFAQGEIYINGKSIRKDPMQCKKELAYIPDNPDLYEHLTGYQYINFIADIYEWDYLTERSSLRNMVNFLR